MGLTAIILAGGLATRMQGEKPLRMLRGRTLLQHTLDLVAPLADEVLVSTGARELEQTGARLVPDPPEFVQRGPLAGILAGLEAAAHSRALVLACDLPNIPRELLSLLVATLADVDCAYTRPAAHDEPLVAALNTAPAAAAARKALAAGVNKVVPCWQALRHRVLTVAELSPFAPLDKAFANINTLAELEREDA